METVGERLKRLRLERGLSQRELASPGVSYAYISRIEAGTRQPSVKALRRLASKLGVSAAYLETGSQLDSEATRELKLTDLELAVRLGEAEGAEQGLEEVLADALAAGDRNSALRARAALAMIAREAGDFQRLVRLLEDALAGEPFLPVERADVYAHLGYGYAASGRPEFAVALYERCLEAVREQGASALEARFATMLSYALSDAGDLARAEQVIQEALERIDENDNATMRVRLYWSLARVAHAENKPALALGNARRAIALLEASEDSLSLARAHLLAASIMVTRGDADGATQHLDQAERLLGAASSFQDDVMLQVKRAQVAALAGDGESATELAREALRMVGDELPQERGTAFWALAEGLTLQGEHSSADDAYRRAVDTLEENHRWREATLACRAWARMLRAAGREQQALDVLERASELGLRVMPAEARA
ncbi:MAG TPA: helix-turn-helix domain-containing protein [Gaiellaceae bacterium]|nr:helix-turn-helix domain-containing protein [Gaiellaceae bacterium]